VHEGLVYETDRHRYSTASVDIPPDNQDLLLDVSRYRNDTPSKKVTALPESVSESASKNPGKNLPALVQEITGGEDDPFQKVKNIHDWIALHISYDSEALSGRIPDQSHTSVLKRGKGVCDGYAELFRVMCEMAGFDCIKVYGYSRGYGSLTETSEKVETNHAWNAVRIGEAWYLVDVTWDAGYLFRSGSFFSEYATNYLFIPPGGMIFTHFPDNRSWQLLKTPYSRKEFLDLPYLTGEYYMVFNGPPKGLKKENRAESGTVIELPPHRSDYLVTVNIVSQREMERYRKQGRATTEGNKYIHIERTPEATLAQVRFPEAGTWYVQIGSREKQSESRPSTVIGEFMFTAERACDTWFPVTGFREKYDYTLHEPIRNPLKVGERVRFSFTIQGEQHAVLAANFTNYENNHYRTIKEFELTAEDGNFEQEMVIPEGANEIGISVEAEDSKPDKEHFNRIVTYEVVE
jgi:hypothetical protein